MSAHGPSVRFSEKRLYIVGDRQNFHCNRFSFLVAEILRPKVLRDRVFRGGTVFGYFSSCFWEFSKNYWFIKILVKFIVRFWWVNFRDFWIVCRNMNSSECTLTKFVQQLKLISLNQNRWFQMRVFYRDFINKLQKVDGDFRPFRSSEMHEILYLVIRFRERSLFKWDFWKVKTKIWWLKWLKNCDVSTL